MADVKISSLPASTVPLAGTEVLPIVQGGATKQVSIANVTAGRDVAALSVTATTVNGTTFDTNVAAAGVTLAGTTLAADGTNANISISLVPKGTGQVVINAGTASLPAITPTGDTNTGIFFPAADTIAFTEGGTEAMRINSSANVGIGTDSPEVKLQVTYAPLTSTTQKNELILQSKADGSASGGALTGITFANWISGYTAGSFSRSSGIYGINTDAASFGRNMGLVFYTSGQDATATEKMRVFTSGGVSIGNTTDPGSTNLSVTGTVRSGGYTVATLPAAGVAGRRAYVTDATLPTYLGVLVGGGAVVCPVFDNGTAWVSA